MSTKNLKKKKLQENQHSKVVEELNQRATTSNQEVELGVNYYKGELRRSHRFVREQAYQLKVQIARISALEYAMTLMETEKKEDHNTKEDLRENNYRF